MLDDIANAMGSFSPPIPFVGASASDANQPAWGPSDAWVGSSGMGSFWTNGLAGAVGTATSGDSVTSTVGTANANDPTAPGGQYAGSLPAGSAPEQPQNTSAHGGGEVTWGTGAESVVFSGNNTNTRHGNNVSNMEDGFLALWGDDPNSNVRSTGDGVNPGTRQGLQDMLNGAASDIDPGEELVLYVDDHGNTEFDLDEWWNWFTSKGIVLDGVTGWRSETPDGLWPQLHDGWLQGLAGNDRQGDPVEPGIKLLAAIAEPVPFDSFFDVFFDGIMLDSPDMIFPGEESLIPFGCIWPLLSGGPHLIEIVPTDLLPFPVPLINLELTSGPVNDLTLEYILLLGDVSIWTIPPKGNPRTFPRRRSRPDPVRHVALAGRPARPWFRSVATVWKLWYPVVTVGCPLGTHARRSYAWRRTTSPSMSSSLRRVKASPPHRHRRRSAAKPSCLGCCS